MRRVPLAEEEWRGLNLDATWSLTRGRAAGRCAPAEKQGSVLTKLKQGVLFLARGRTRAFWKLL